MIWIPHQLQYQIYNTEKSKTFHRKTKGKCSLKCVHWQRESVCVWRVWAILRTVLKRNSCSDWHFRRIVSSGLMICIGMKLKLISLTFDWTLWDWLHTRGDYSDTWHLSQSKNRRRRIKEEKYSGKRLCCTPVSASISDCWSLVVLLCFSDWLKTYIRKSGVNGHFHCSSSQDGLSAPGGLSLMLNCLRVCSNCCWFPAK